MLILNCRNNYFQDKKHLRSALLYGIPDLHFPNFSASRSGDHRILCSSGTSSDGFCSSNIVKGFVGLA